MKPNHLRLFFFLSGFLFALDQFLKYLAYNNKDFTFYILKPWFGWEYFPNPGIAFGLPVPQKIIFFLTPLILLGLAMWWRTNKHKTKNFYLGVCLVYAGALSNLIDRIVFSVTIDYLRVFTSVMNIADIIIVIGAVLLLHKSKNK